MNNEQPGQEKIRRNPTPEILQPQIESPESESDKAEQDYFIEIIFDEDISDETALTLVANSEPETAMRSLPNLAESYGIDLTDIPQDKLLGLASLYSELNQTKQTKHQAEIKSALQSRLHEALAQNALQKIDELSANIEANLENDDLLKNLLRQTMETLGRLSKNIPQDSDHELWNQMYDKYKHLINIKLTDAKSSAIFSEIFQEFSDFIDNEFAIKAYNYSLANKLPYDVESVMQLTYGRSSQEMEEIKKNNRKNAVAKLHELQSKETFDLEDIIELHRANNRGITPSPFSRLRTGDELETFGKRFGILPEDVAEEMKAWRTRVNDTIKRAKTEKWTNTRYEIAVAQLHNQILDIHPFLDRNGSTSLLFMELMMMRRGHVPSEKRDKDYYKIIRRILGNNPVAIALVGYEMSLISYVPGYYKGVTTAGKASEYKSQYKY